MGGWFLVESVEGSKDLEGNGGNMCFSIIFSNSDFLLVRMLKVFRHVCDWDVPGCALC